MPVIAQLSQAIKIGKTASGGMPAEASAVIDAMSQAQVAGPSLQPIPFLPGVIPVIPFGIGISIIMTKIEAMMFKGFEDLESITKKLMQKYETDKVKAETQRKAASTKLYNDLIAKQAVIKEELVVLEKEKEDIEKKLPELQALQTSEMEKYMQVIFEIKNSAKKAEDDGNLVERDRLLGTISIHDNWLGEIIKISVEIITLQFRLPSLQREIDSKKILVDMSIQENWEVNVDLADLFEVAIPPYPDMPSLPQLPTIPPIPKESEFVKAMRKAFGKWVVTPTILPMGIPLCAILLYIQSQATAPPQLAAKIESAADASILQGAGLI